MIRVERLLGKFATVSHSVDKVAKIHKSSREPSRLYPELTGSDGFATDYNPVLIQNADDLGKGIVQFIVRDMMKDRRSHDYIE